CLLRAFWLAVGGSTRALLLVAPLVECADHIQRAFLPLVTFAAEDRLTAGNRFSNCDGATRYPGESFCHGEWLRQKALQASCPLDDSTILGAELFDAEERDHVLQLAVMLDAAPDFGGDGRVLFSDDERIKQDRR